MSRFNAAERGLVIAQFDNQRDYANACIVNYSFITAGHVASVTSRVISPHTNEYGVYQFILHPSFDIAIAHSLAAIEGFSSVEDVQLGQTVVVQGFHGTNYQRYAIPTRVVDIYSTGQVIVEKKNRTDVFRPGMSGSAGVIDQAVIGVLSRGVDHQDSRILLEPVAAVLKR